MDHPPSSASGPSETGDRAQVSVRVAPTSTRPLSLDELLRVPQASSAHRLFVDRGRHVAAVVAACVDQLSGIEGVIPPEPILVLKIDEAEAADLLTAQAAKLEAAEEWAETVTRGKSPCGHWKAYAVTEDGGKTITCLQCRTDAAETKLEVAERLIPQWREYGRQKERATHCAVAAQLFGCAHDLEAALSSASARPAEPEFETLAHIVVRDGQVVYEKPADQKADGLLGTAAGADAGAPAPRRLTAPDLEWAIDRLRKNQAIAETSAGHLGQKILKGYGYPDEVMRDAQDALAYRIVLAQLGALKDRAEDAEGRIGNALA